MQNKIDRIVSLIYKRWRQKLRRTHGVCPDEETIVSFLEGRLSQKESRELKSHLVGCDRCLEIVVLTQQEVKDVPLPEALIQRAKNLIMHRQSTQPLLEIILGFREKIIDIIKTSGDILFGQEFAPLPVLRSRNIKDFGQEVIIVKNFDKIKTEIEVENKANYYAKIIVKISDINTGKSVAGLRVTLIHQGQEVESYIADSGKAIFDNVSPSKYSIEISSTEEILGTIVLEIRKINEVTG